MATIPVRTLSRRRRPSRSMSSRQGRAWVCHHPSRALSTLRSSSAESRMPPRPVPGLAVLSPSGLELNLISGAFAVTDNGTGNDT